MIANTLGKFALINVTKSKRPKSLILKNVLCKYINTSTLCKRIAGKPYGQYNFPDSQAEVEESKDDWHFVERLIPPKVIKYPSVKPGTVMPSGWVAPSAGKEDHKYFVKRNASHMLRVYFYHHVIMTRTLTFIRGIEGDIFALAKDLEPYLLEKSNKRRISLRVVEPHSKIVIRGDFVNAVKQFLINKGF